MGSSIKDPKLQSYLKEIIETFHKNGFDIAIYLSKDGEYAYLGNVCPACVVQELDSEFEDHTEYCKRDKIVH